MYTLGILHKIMLQEKKHGTNSVFYMAQIIRFILARGEEKKVDNCTKMLATVFKQQQQN